MQRCAKSSTTTRLSPCLRTHYWSRGKGSLCGPLGNSDRSAARALGVIIGQEVHIADGAPLCWGDAISDGNGGGGQHWNHLGEPLVLRVLLHIPMFHRPVLHLETDLEAALDRVRKVIAVQMTDQLDVRRLSRT